MALKTAEEYRESLRKMRPNVYKFGELIEDVTTHPATKRTINGHAQLFEAYSNPEYADLFTTTSHLTGEKVSRYLSIVKSAEDAINNVKMKRAAYHLTGTCTGGRCVGWTSLNSLWATTWEMDQEYGTNYHERLKNWLLYAQANDITCAGALTDAKGNRALPPSMQKDPDLNLHVVEKREDGIVVRGAKCMICGIAAANEIFCLPGGAYKEPDKDYAVAIVVPKDIEGLTIVETRRPSDVREYEEGFDIPNDIGGITQAYLLFNDVFVPNDRVFMCGEFKYCLNAIQYFTSTYRAAIGGCVAGQGDLKVGASIIMARANGLSMRTFYDKLIQMQVNNETTFGMGVAASALGKEHPSGCWLCDSLVANSNKVHVATLPYETNRLAQEIAGGIGETGCLPSYKDIMDSNYGDLIKKYIEAGLDWETRAKGARLVEWLTLGPGVPGCMHGGGSPDAGRLMVRVGTPWEKWVELAKRVGGIKAEVPEPPKPKKK